MTDDSIYFDGDEYDRLSLVQGRRGGGAGQDLELAFYLEHAAAAAGSVLELACGTGRLTIPIAGAGHETVGIDIAEPMLRVARAKAQQCARPPAFITADVRAFDLGRRFACVLYPDSAMSHLHSAQDLAQALACVRAHVAPGGAFIVAVFNPSLAILTRDPAQRHPNAEYVDAAGRHVVVTENNAYDAATQVNHVRWYYAREGEPEAVRRLALRMFFPQELRLLLRHHGFSVEAVYGDFDRSPLVGSSPRQVAVCHPS